MSPAPSRTCASPRRLVVLLAVALALGVGGCHRPTSGTAPPRGVDTASVRVDVEHLASPALEGRGTGTAGNDSAAVYIARRFGALGLSAVITASCDAPPCDPGFLQPFVARSVAARHAGLPDSMQTANVVAVQAGSDAALRDEYVVVGAHFDHLGRATFGALDPQAGEAIRHGADDNASGTAVVMELARLFRDRPARRSIIFIGFSGEELGLLGSQHFVQNPPVPLEQMVAMVNFDMVGRLRNDRLIIFGTATAPEFGPWIDSANATAGLDIRAVGDGFGPSDHASFYARGIPVLHFFTDLHDDYHRATDVAERVDIAGMRRVIEIAERVIRRMADANERPRVVQVAARRSARSGGTGAYLGTVPDMTAVDVEGVRLTAVRAGSPAEAGGLKEGDVIVEFAGQPIRDLYDFTDALNERRPGDTLELVVLRGGERIRLRVTLGERGR